MNQTSQQPSLKEKQSHGTRLFPCAYYHFCNPSHRLRVRITGMRRLKSFIFITVLSNWISIWNLTELTGNVFYLLTAENFILCVPEYGI